MRDCKNGFNFKIKLLIKLLATFCRDAETLGDFHLSRVRDTDVHLKFNKKCVTKFKFFSFFSIELNSVVF